MFHSRAVPACFRRFQIREFRHSKRVIWVKTRKHRDEVLTADRTVTWSAHKYRQCKRCGRKLLGLQAQIRVADEEGARRPGIEPPPRTKNCVPIIK